MASKLKYLTQPSELGRFPSITSCSFQESFILWNLQNSKRLKIFLYKIPSTDIRLQFSNNFTLFFWCQ